MRKACVAPAAARRVLVAGLLLAGGPALADVNGHPPPRSLLDLQIREKDVQAGVLTHYTRIARTNALLVGGAVELILNDAIGIGVSHLSLANEIQTDDVLEPLSVSQTSALFDVIVGAKYRWFGRFALGIGTIVVAGTDLDGEETATRGPTFEPELAWGVNLYPHVRVGFGWSYRFAIMPGDSLVSSKQLTGANALVSLALGLD